MSAPLGRKVQARFRRRSLPEKCGSPRPSRVKPATSDKRIIANRMDSAMARHELVPWKTGILEPRSLPPPGGASGLMPVTSC